MLELNGIELGELSIVLYEPVGVLLFAEFPTTIIYSDNNKQPIVKEWVDCSDDGKTDRYFYFKTTKNLLYRFIKKDISHQDLISNAIDGFLYFENTSAIIGKAQYFLISVNQFPKEYIPAVNYFAKETDLVDADKIIAYFSLDSINFEIQLLDEVKFIATKHNSETLNFHLKEGKGVGYGTVDSAILGKTLTSFENLYREIALDCIIGAQRGEVSKKERVEILPYLATEIYENRIAASYSLLIRPKAANYNLFDGISDSERIMNRTINLITNSVEVEQLKIEYPTHSDFTINSYKIFLKTIYESELGLDLNWYNPTNEHHAKEKINYIKANAIINNLDTLDIVTEEEFKKKGKFRCINLNTLYFIFIGTDSGEFSGHFEKNVSDNIDLVNFKDIYEVKIMRTMTKEPGKKTAHIDDKIISYYPIVDSI